MDGQRFDVMTRAMAGRGSRRGAVGWLAGLAGAFLAVGAAEPSRAGFNCTYIGCGCATGTLHPCNDGLICCASSPGTPGGAGVCSNPSDCDAPCAGTGGYCSDSCNWGDTCPECCSGYCGNLGRCA